MTRAVAWEKQRPIGNTQRSRVHRCEVAGKTLCGVLVPTLDRVSEVFRGPSVPADLAACAVCAALDQEAVVA